MDILIVGGTPSHRGGVELFCERARHALVNIGDHHVEWVHSNTSYLRLTSIGRVAKCAWELVRRRNQQWDCLWLQYVNLPDLVLLLASRLCGYRVLVTPHLGSNWSSQSNRLLRSLGVKLLGFAHGIALISDTQAEEIALPSSVPQMQIRTFLPSVFPSEPQRLRARKLALVHAGRLSDGKGTFLFLQVCTILKQRGCEFGAQLIGSCDAATRRRIDGVIMENDLAASVELLGLLPEVRLLEALSAADALIHLSNIDSFPLIVLEAIGCGAFPICKDLPGARFITETYCGTLVAGPNIASDVADLLAGTSAAALRGEAALARGRLAADYSWEQCVAALERSIGGLPPGRVGRDDNKAHAPAFGSGAVAEQTSAASRGAAPRTS